MLFSATWMDLDITIQSKVRKKKPYDITYMWNLKYDTDQYIYGKNRLTDRKQTCGCREGK